MGKKQANETPKAKPPQSIARTRASMKVLLAFSALWLAPTLACGSFAPRPTPTPSPIAPPTDIAASVETPDIAPTPILVIDETPLPAAGNAFTSTTGVVDPAPTDTPAPPTPAPNVLAPGNRAIVTAPGGLNMRNSPTTSGGLLLQLATSAVVTILEGPSSADGYTWWRVDDGSGNAGWVVQGDGTDQWLVPNTGAGSGSAVLPVDRSPTVGERVVTNTSVSVRSLPSTSANLLTYTAQGQQFSVLAGPQSADGYTWYQIRSDDGTILGWAAEGDGTTRWLSPLE